MLSGTGIKHFEGKQIVVGVNESALSSVPVDLTTNTPMFFESADEYGLLILVGQQGPQAAPLYLPWSAISGVTLYGKAAVKRNAA